MSNLQLSEGVLAAIERTKIAETQLKEDLIRVCCWVEGNRPGQRVSIELQRHYGCGDKELAHVLPLVQDQEVRRTIRAEAEAAFQALGWILKPEGRDVRSIYGRTQGQSQHDRLRYYSEIHNLLRYIENADPECSSESQF